MVNLLSLCRVYNEINKIVDTICKHITKGGELADDLKQEVILELLKKGDIEHRYQTQTLYTYAYGIAYKMYHLHGSAFHRKHRKYRYYESEELDQVHDHVEQDLTESQVQDLINELDEMDRLWMREYKRRNCSAKKLAEDTGVSRPSVMARIKHIINEIRCTNLN